MLGLPQSTEVNRPLPKAQLYKRFDWKPSQRECFDGDVSRLDFVNWIAPRTLPAIAEGAEVKEIFVIEVSLKNRDYDPKNIALLAKSIPQCVIYLLRFQDEAMLAVYYTRLFHTPWRHADGVSLRINGMNLNIVWENIVREIANFTFVGTSLCDVEHEDNGNQNQHAKGMSLQALIIANEARDRLLRQIAALERQMNATRQPRRKRELFLELQRLKNKITL